jgi:hypothetical protein
LIDLARTGPPARFAAGFLFDWRLADAGPNAAARVNGTGPNPSQWRESPCGGDPETLGNAARRPLPLPVNARYDDRTRSSTAGGAGSGVPLLKGGSGA